jgi:hypothetical protein
LKLRNHHFDIRVLNPQFHRSDPEHVGAAHRQGGW